jgi:hypothetical protein
MMAGSLMKLKTRLESGSVHYDLVLGEQSLYLNDLLGKQIEMRFTGDIHCIATGEKIKKSYNQGYSYKAFMTLPECDICIVKPELCHFDKGTCRDSDWGLKHCFQPHCLYLAYSSDLKVGITREHQIPTRFMDQGALFALPILRLKSRHASGVLEAEIAKEMSDRTNWRKMLQAPENDFDPRELEEKRQQLFEDYGDLIDELEAEDLDHGIIELNYPVLEYPKKIKSLGFDKDPVVKGVLLGLKGQYLILDTGVINMRKHQGYQIEWMD